jgi:predicted XRE-type DNA-binding protein
VIPDGQITPSSGNVFEDVGFPPEEARRLLLQSDLAIAIEQIIKDRKLSQAKAAKLFGVSQPRISDLMRNKLELFSIDALISMLSRAGVAVTITLEPRAA